MIGRITAGDVAAYRREVASLVSWCEDNNLTLNTDKKKEIIVDMRKERRPHRPLFIQELEVERVSNFRIPVQGMLFGRKLGLLGLDRAVELFCSFERRCSSFSKTLPSASVLEGLALFKIWKAFFVLPFTFALKAPQALNHKVLHPSPTIHQQTSSLMIVSEILSSC